MTWATKQSIIMYDQIKDRIAKKKYLRTIRATETIPIAWTYTTRKHSKDSNFM